MTTRRFIVTVSTDADPEDWAARALETLNHSYGFDTIWSVEPMRALSDRIAELEVS